MRVSQTGSRPAMPTVLFCKGTQVPNISPDSEPFRNARAAAKRTGQPEKAPVLFVGDLLRPRFHGLVACLRNWRGRGVLFVGAVSRWPQVGNEFEDLFPDFIRHAGLVRLGGDHLVQSITQNTGEEMFLGFTCPVIIAEPTLDAVFAIAEAYGVGYPGMAADAEAVSGSWVDWKSLSPFGRQCAELVMGTEGPSRLPTILEHLFSREVNQEQRIDGRSKLGKLYAQVGTVVLQATRAYAFDRAQYVQAHRVLWLRVPYNEPLDDRELAARVLRDDPENDFGHAPDSARRDDVDAVLVERRKNKVFTTVVLHSDAGELCRNLHEVVDVDLRGGDPFCFVVPGQATKLVQRLNALRAAVRGSSGSSGGGGQPPVQKKWRGSGSDRLDPGGFRWGK